MTRSLSSSPLPDLAAEPSMPARSATPFEPLFSQRTPKWETLFGSGPQPANDVADLGNILEDFAAVPDPELSESLDGLPTIPDAPSLDPSADLSFTDELAHGDASAGTVSQAEHQAMIEDLTKQYEDRIAELQETDEACLARCLSECGDALKTAGADLIENALAKAFTPVMEEFLEAAALRALAEELAHVVRDGKATRLVVRGGEASLEKLRDQLGEQADGFRFEPEDRTELLAEVDETVISTCVQEWRERLAVKK